MLLVARKRLADLPQLRAGKLRTDLMIQLSKLIQARGLTQADAAELFGVTQPRVSGLVRGKIDSASTHWLPCLDMLGFVCRS